MIASLALVTIAIAPPAVLSKPEPLTIENTTSVIGKARASVKKLTKNDIDSLRQFANQLHKKCKDREEQELRQVICQSKFAIAEDFCALGDTYCDVMGEQGPAKLAQRYYAQALEIDPDCSRAYGNLAELALIENQKEVALKYATRGLACKQRSPLAFTMHANVLATMKRYKEALASLTQAEKDVEMSAEMWRVKGSVLENLDRLDDAVASYRKSLSVEYSDWAAFQSLIAWKHR
jgi:hypothetical protein